MVASLGIVQSRVVQRVAGGDSGIVQSLLCIEFGLSDESHAFA
jgi:hypothetical protein